VRPLLELADVGVGGIRDQRYRQIDHVRHVQLGADQVSAAAALGGRVAASAALAARTRERSTKEASGTRARETSANVADV